MAGFSPTVNGTYLLNVGATSSAITLPDRPGTVRIYNGGSNTLYISIGGVATIPGVGTPGSMPLASGAGSIPLLLEKGAQPRIEAICAVAGPTPVFITLGHGETVG